MDFRLDLPAGRQGLKIGDFIVRLLRSADATLGASRRVNRFLLNEFRISNNKSAISGPMKGLI